MKRSLKIMLMLMIAIVVFAGNSCFAKIEDKKAYENSFKEVIPDGNKVLMENNIITITPKGTETPAVEMTYSLASFPVFTMKVKITKDMSYSKYVEEMSKYTYFEYCFKALKSQIEENKAYEYATYFRNKTTSIEKSPDIKEDDFNATVAMLLTKQTYSEPIENDVFKLDFVTEEDSESSLEIKLALKIKVLDTDKNIELGAGGAKTIETSSTEQEDDTTLPKTGPVEDVILGILYTVIAISSIGVVGLLYTLKRDEK